MITWFIWLLKASFHNGLKLGILRGAKFYAVMRQNMGAGFGKCLGQGKDKNGELIGGCDITIELYESGELARIVAEAGKA